MTVFIAKYMFSNLKSGLGSLNDFFSVCLSLIAAFFSHSKEYQCVFLSAVCVPMCLCARMCVCLQIFAPLYLPDGHSK